MMHRSRRLRIAAILGAAFAMAAPHASRADPKGKVVVSHLSAPLQGSTFAYGENIALAGEVHFHVQAWVGDSESPLDPCRVDVVLQHVVGVGQDTGLRYRAEGTAQLSAPLPPPNDYGFTAGFQVHPTDPAQPTDPHSCDPQQPIDPCRSAVRLFLTVDVNAEGVATAASAEVTVGGDTDVDSPG